MAERTHLSINPDPYRLRALALRLPDAEGRDRRVEALADALIVMCDKYDELRAFFGVVPGEWLKWDDGHRQGGGRGT